MATVVDKSRPEVAADPHIKSKLELIDEQLEENAEVLEEIATNTAS